MCDTYKDTCVIMYSNTLNMKTRNSSITFKQSISQLCQLLFVCARVRTLIWKWDLDCRMLYINLPPLNVWDTVFSTMHINWRWADHIIKNSATRSSVRPVKLCRNFLIWGFPCTRTGCHSTYTLRVCVINYMDRWRR